MKNFFILFIIFLNSENFYCQEKYTDVQIKNELKILASSVEYNNSKLKHYEYLYQKSKETGYINGEINSLLGCAVINYQLFQNFDQIISQTQKAEILAEENSDLYSVSVAKAFRSGVFIHFGLLRQGKKELDEGCKISDEIEDPNLKYLAKLYCYKFYSAFYNAKKDHRSAVFWAKKMVERISYSDNLSVEKRYLEKEALGTITTSYLKLADFKNAEKFLKLTEIHLENNHDNYYWAVYLKNKADFTAETEKEKNNTETLLNLYLYSEKKAILSDNFLVLDDIYPKIAKLYEKENNITSQVYYLNKSNKIKDSLSIAENEAFDKMNFNGESGNSREKSVFYIILILFIVVIGTVLYLYFNRSQSEKTSNDTVGPKEISDEDLYKLASEDPSSFVIFFMKNFPDFSDKILAVNSTMKNSDIEFLAFLKIGLSDQQIAQSKKNTLKSVAAKKYRIRKKLNISGDEKLNLWLSNL